jgi:nucleoid DNA-binding protein
MTKAEFISSVAQKTGFTKTVAAEALDAVLSSLVERTYE